MSDVDLQRIALQAKADEHHDETAARARVAEYEGATGVPPPPPLTPEEEQAAAEKVQLAALEKMIMGQLPKVCAVLWGGLDRLAIQYAGPQYAQTPDERAALAEATVPVVLKYLPKDLTWLANTPEGALILTAVSIYAIKALAPAPAVAPAPVESVPAPAEVAP